MIERAPDASATVIAAAPARAAAWAVLAFVACWPKFGVSELIALLAGAAMLVALLRGRVTLTRRQWLLGSVVFLSYWLPELWSAPDALARGEAWREVALDLRYAPFVALLMLAGGTPGARALVLRGVGWIAALWAADALVQAATGWSLGGQMLADRLSGIFGADNLKLGWVLTVLAPFLLALAASHGRGWWLLAAVAVAVVVLLAGARAAWLGTALVVGGSALAVFGARRRVLVSAAAIGLGLLSLAYLGSDRFVQRIERTAAVLSGNVDGLDTALSYRLPIWSAAVRMSVEHPLNGIGVRGFREHYAQFVAPDDHWLQGPNNGAFHAHQWVLEVLAETGVPGLVCWILGLSVLYRHWRGAPVAARAAAAAPGLALVAALFPLNTHLASYSSFWGGVLLLLLGLFAAALAAAPEPAR